MIVREATATDRDMIVKIFLDCWRESYIGVLPDVAIQAMTEERAGEIWDRALTSERETILVTSQGNTVCGVTRFTGEGNGKDGAIFSLYVSPKAQGQGLGTLLLEAAYNTLRDRGAQSVTLWVFAGNTPSIAFYHGRGWVPDGGTRTEKEFGQMELRLRRTEP